jgi:hypothetical protein
MTLNGTEKKKLSLRDSLMDLGRIHHQLARTAFLERNGNRQRALEFIDWTKKRVASLLADPQVEEQPFAKFLIETLLHSEDSLEAKAKQDWYRDLLNLPSLPTFVEQKILAELHRAGSVSDYIYNRYITEFSGAPEETHRPFLEFVRKLLDYQKIPRGGLEDYFAITLMEHPEKVKDFVASYDLWIRAQNNQTQWSADPADPFDIAIFYFKVLPTLKLRKPPTFDEFIEKLMAAASNEMHARPGGISYGDLWKYFGYGGSSGPIAARNRRAVQDFKNSIQEAEELSRLRSLQLPPAILELSPVVQFVAIRYLQNLPLGVRERHHRRL